MAAACRDDSHHCSSRICPRTSLRQRIACSPLRMSSTTYVISIGHLVVDMNNAQPWFALQTRPRNEKRVDYLLKQKGYEAFTPTYWQRRRWSDRTTEIELP